MKRLVAINLDLKQQLQKKRRKRKMPNDDNSTTLSDNNLGTRSISLEQRGQLIVFNG
jgi:hypothetical protein